MKAALRQFLTPIHASQLPSLRAHLRRGASAYGRALVGIYSFMVLPLLFGDRALLVRQLPMVGLSIGAFVLILRRLHRPSQPGDPERGLLGMVLVLALGMCVGGWTNGKGSAEDLQFIWVLPIGVASFA